MHVGCSVGYGTSSLGLKRPLFWACIFALFQWGVLFDTHIPFKIPSVITKRISVVVHSGVELLAGMVKLFPSTQICSNLLVKIHLLRVILWVKSRFSIFNLNLLQIVGKFYIEKKIGRYLPGPPRTCIFYYLYLNWSYYSWLLIPKPNRSLQ